MDLQERQVVFRPAQPDEAGDDDEDKPRDCGDERLPTGLLRRVFTVCSASRSERIPSAGVSTVIRSRRRIQMKDEFSAGAKACLARSGIICFSNIECESPDSYGR